jgi:serine/threonine protein kinase/tetratricopeptide (TPR) repeat protein
MTADRWERLNEIFHAALALDAADRAALLDSACAGDQPLRTEVERLIAAHERAGRFIELPAIASGDEWPDAEPDAPLPGRRFGPYGIVREIGRGGMGAVYLAERADGQYQQRAAIKLIKRGMDTDLVLRRFRAERQILASLEHPNIARLLDGGTADDGRPYLVMEYVEGEPIDQYADARRLSIAERLRLFLQVCGAVAYAHGRRVVHRDIKPVNIMVSPDGVPKLLDFGISKVLEPDREEPTASITGFRLLTPEYASPEQIDGRHATPASDVYSLGVVLYELLTGRSPYRPRSRDPLDVVEAVRTTDPQRPSTAVVLAGPAAAASPRRPGLERDRAAATGSVSTDRLGRQLRGDLDTIVLTALQKDPLRRYAAVELLAQDIRRHLDGLPVLAQRDSIWYRGGKFLRRNRPTVVAATLVGVVVLLLGIGFVALRAAAARREGPSLVASGVFASRDRILVADFADHAGDPALAAALTDAFRDDLTQSPFVRVLSPRQVRATLVQMERSADLALDDSLAREVAVRGNVTAIVTGSVTKVAGSYTLSSQLVSAARGDMLAAFREIAADSGDVIGAVDRLSKRMRQKMGEALPSIRATPPLEQVTTSSLSALRAYSEGVRVINAGDRARGVKLLEAAVALDTGFASAYRVLGVTYGDMVERGRASAAIEHAIANQARLPFYERNHAIATHAYNTLGDYQAAIDAYHRILERYPDDVRALNNLGYVHSLRREFIAQESLLVRAASIDSTIPSVLTSLVVARVNRGDFEGARRELDRIARRYPGLHNALLAEIYLPAARQDWETAERQARARLAAQPEDTLDALDGWETLAGIVMTRGHLAEAERDSRKVLALSVPMASPGRYLSSALRLGYLELGYRNDTTRALATVGAALLRFPLDSIQEGDRPWYELARFFAAAGHAARARDLITRAERSGASRRVDPNRRWALGGVALAEGRLHDAQVDLVEAAEITECSICVLPDLARSYEAIGKPDSAIAVYEHYLRLPWQWRFETDAVELGWSMKRLGELYQQRGEPAKAIAVYTRLLDLWRQADPALQPVLGEVRRRIASLGAAAPSA